MLTPSRTAHQSVVRLGLLVAIACSGIASVAAAEDEKDKPLPPQEVTLTTSDGVALVATYYPSKLGKQAVPVLLLHAYKGNRGDLAELALKLQEVGHAVIAPDLRGHGDSSGPEGELRADDFAAMAMRRGDLQAVKNFLFDQNNAGKLNIDKLCVVGLEMGAAVALNWALTDWSWPPLASGKQGQDVKALVLISPTWSFNGLRINHAVAHPQIRSQLSVLLITGRRNSRLVREARRLYNAFDRYHAEPRRDEPDKQTLWLKTPATSLQSTELLDERGLEVPDMIAEFIELRLVDQNFPWADRTHPFE